MSRNYYEPPQVNPLSQQPPRGPRPKALPGFVVGYMIADIVFCLLRAMLVLVGIFTYMAMLNNAPGVPGADSPLAQTAIYEILTGVGIVVFGLAAGILILCKKPAGVVFGYLALLFTAGSFAVGLWQTPIMTENAPAGSPEATGMVIGMVFAILVRAVLAVLYFVALSMAKKALVTNH